MKALKKVLAAALVAAPLVGIAQTPPAEPAKPAEQATPAPTTTATPAAPAPAAKPADDAIKVTPYGFVLLNAFYDMDTFTVKDYPGQAASADAGEAFIMSGRQSRFGVRLSGKDTALTGADLTGVIEFDFKAGHVATSSTCTDDGDPATAPVCTIGGANTASTGFYNGLMRLRLASATASWKMGTNTFSVLFGQDYGLVNPLFAESLAWVADPLFWQAGNLWRRSPQVRLTWAGKFGDMGLTLQGAVLSPADATGPVDFGAGNASATPDLEARAAVSAKFGDIGGTVGVGYHREKREYQTAATAAVPAVVQDELDTNLVGVDADLTLTKFLQVKGEFYTGSGADDTYFGIAPSVSGAAGARDTVDSQGFWVQGIVKPSPLLSVTVGYGQAEADDDIVTAATARQENSQLAFGAIVNAGKAWRFGVEFCKTTTKYGAPPVAGGSDEFDASQLAISSMLRF